MTDGIKLVCPGCEAIVRVPAGRMRDRPRCPRCATAVVPDRPITLGAAGFDRHLEHCELPLVAPDSRDNCALALN